MTPKARTLLLFTRAGIPSQLEYRKGCGALPSVEFRLSATQAWNA